MNYTMNLNPEPFKLIKNKKKTIEMRLNDERRKNLKVNDTIDFINTKTKQVLKCKILHIEKYDNFKQLYQNYNKKDLGYLEDEIANPDDMLEYYSQDLINKYGVLAIKIELIDYVAVFSDLDGTLLDDSKNITNKNLLAIKELLSNNYHFVFVSARGPMAIYPIFEKYNFRCPIIAYSGALILDENKNVLYSKGFDKQICQNIIDFIENNHLDCVWNIYSIDKWLVKDRNHIEIIKEEKAVEANSSVGNISMLDKDELVSKMLIVCNVNKTIEIENKLKQQFPFLSIVKSSNFQIEIMQKDISKGNGIKIYCDNKNIDINQTIGFGDHYNDLNMLETVKLPFIMLNGPQDLKDKIKNITPKDNNHDGVYYALKDLNIVD